ncbi:hypothetical protein N7452_004756 [Penicillium brevicompactum]|uniref:DUF3074 domain-containing protein n=1 Tax=Penicillium brevicompactum TaxID=5074 RepID=A0A9W9UEG7_PENBR|nr:hypothetical protein N7452_004756 [Penicillium brevicompactum]
MSFIRLEPHPLRDLPSHTNFRGPKSKPLESLIDKLLRDEAEPLLNKLRTDLREEPKLRPSPPSTAQVKLSQGTLQNEFWVCRQSDHQDSPADGTGSWREFENGLRHDHAEHEMEYTPSVTKVKQLLNWNQDGSWDPNMRIEVSDRRYKDFIVELNLIVHTFHPGALIRPRAFISWTVSAAISNITPENEPEGTSFITIQVPFRLSDAAEDPVYQQLCADALASVPPRTIFAHYASIEQVELLHPSDSSDRMIRWTMATASEAGGKIPQWVQRNWTLGGVPKAVVADVGLFIGWIMKQRGQRGRPLEK